MKCVLHTCCYSISRPIFNNVMCPIFIIHLELTRIILSKFLFLLKVDTQAALDAIKLLCSIQIDDFILYKLIRIIFSVKLIRIISVLMHKISQKIILCF